MRPDVAQRSKVGIVAVILGATALVVAVLHFFAGPIAAGPPIEEIVAETATRIRDATAAKLSGEAYEGTQPIRQRTVDDWLELATVATGLTAILLAVASFIRREDVRVCGSAMALGGGAIAFQFMALALGVVALAILIAGVLGTLGASP